MGLKVGLQLLAYSIPQNKALPLASSREEVGKGNERAWHTLAAPWLALSPPTPSSHLKACYPGKHRDM